MAKYSYIQHEHRIFSEPGNKCFDPAIIAGSRCIFKLSCDEVVFLMQRSTGNKNIYGINEADSETLKYKEDLTWCYGS